MFVYHWLESTLDKLAEIYVAATPAERVRIADGVEAFNTSLATDPLEVGESRQGGFRVAFPPLLRIYFRVDVASRSVLVIDVARYGH
jgi:hypothetical protein